MNNTNCNCNKSIPQPCGCPEPEICGCDKKIPLTCTYYDGDDLVPTGIKNGMDGDLVVKILNDYLANHSGSGTQPPVFFKNVGGKVILYDGLDTDNKHKFKTIDGKEGVIVQGTTATVEAKIDQPWFKLFLEESWFLTLIQTLLSGAWFLSLIQSLLSGAWFLTLIQSLLSGAWFVTLLKTIFNTQEMQSWFSSYITNLIVTEQIDICTLIEKCIEPYDGPPVMTGDITYYPANRSVNFPVSSSDFISKYSDPEGDAFTSIKITGGNLTGLRKADLTPLNIGDIVPVGSISGIKYDSPNQDSMITQTVTYVAINSKGQQSN